MTSPNLKCSGRGAKGWLVYFITQKMTIWTPFPPPCHIWMVLWSENHTVSKILRAPTPFALWSIHTAPSLIKSSFFRFFRGIIFKKFWKFNRFALFLRKKNRGSPSRDWNLWSFVIFCDFLWSFWSFLISSHSCT